jgi:hypothetical protein
MCLGRKHCGEEAGKYQRRKIMSTSYLSITVGSRLDIRVGLSAQSTAVTMPIYVLSGAASLFCSEMTARHSKVLQFYPLL